MENTTTDTVRRRNQVRWSRFVFTLNNYTEAEYEQLKETSKTTKWFIMGKEVAPATGTPHLQGACVIGKQLALSSIKKWPGMARAHLEEMKGSPVDSHKYCSKDGDYYEWGTSPKPGERNDLKNVAQRVLAGATMQELASDPETSSMIIKYSRGLIALRSFTIPPRDPTTPPTVIWIHGPTGSCKTRTAFEASKRIYGCDPWISNGGLFWFDGYDGQPVAILDDYRTGDCKWQFFLRLLDRYPLRVPVKGGFTEWVPRLVFVTAPGGHQSMWNFKTPEAVSQLTRRITAEISAPEELPRVHELRRADGGALLLPALPEERPLVSTTPVLQQQQPVLDVFRRDPGERDLVNLSFRNLALLNNWDDEDSTFVHPKPFNKH